MRAAIPYPGDGASLDQLVAYYFSASYTQTEILGFLFFVHNIMISKSSLKRILKRLSLKRNNIESPLADIVTQIFHLRSRGYGNIGYRSMWKLLNTLCGLRVTQGTVRLVHNVIDYNGVLARRRHRLERRSYFSQGPNYCLHIDGYDKLKPFGISIHGCIDGFSRKILWLKASHTNKNPRHVARNFVEYLKLHHHVPRLVRTDAGTENGVIHHIQIALRLQHNDNMAGHRSVSVGRSTANQRIEMLWSFLMRNFTTFWRNLFSNMIDEGKLNNTDPIQLECVRFCFLPVIQKHLDTFTNMWNLHRIRSQRNNEQSYGIPDVMYYQPILYGKTDCALQFPCDEQVLETILELFTEEHLPRGTSADFRQLLFQLTGMNIAEFDIIETPTEAEKLYCLFLRLFNIY